MNSKRGKFLLSLIAAALSVAAWAGEISGTVAYREKIALPSNAIVTVRLEDVSVADAPSKLVSELRFATGGKQVPFKFKLPYVDSALKKGWRYQLRASIQSGGAMLFTTTQAYPLVAQQTKPVNLLLQKVAVIVNPLFNVTWKLMDLNGTPVIVGGKGAPTIKFDQEGGRFSCFLGVNQLSGSFELSGSSLNIAPGPQTLIGASQELMDQERALSTALKETTSYRLMDGRLDLLKGSEVIARFQK
jgi:putative lipoprotein